MPGKSTTWTRSQVPTLILLLIIREMGYCVEGASFRMCYIMPQWFKRLSRSAYE